MQKIEERALKLKDSVKEGAQSAKRFLSEPLVYEVVQDSPVFEEPVPQCRRTGMVGEGSTIRGYPGSVAWVRTDSGAAAGWVPVREMTTERGLVLHAAWCKLKLEKSFVDALEVSWEGIKDPPPPYKATYSLEWRPRPPDDASAAPEPMPTKKASGKNGRRDPAVGQAAGHTLSSEAAATLRSLPPGSRVQLRVGVRVAPPAGGENGADLKLSGPWQDFCTDQAVKADYEDRSSISSLMSLRAAGALPKRFLRAVRGGLWGLEYRVNEMGDDGVFSPEAVDAGTPIEVCPLLEVDSDCRRRSPVLKRITLPLPGKEGSYAAVLGFAQLYSSSKEPNLHWGYLGPDEVLLWAVEDIPARDELFVDFSSPAQPVEEAAKRRPKLFHEPPQKLRSAAEKFNGAGFVMHGTSHLHGRGVFATRTTEPGQLIESNPIIQMDEAGAEALISYRWGAKNRGAGPFYIPMGNGCLYNHSERQNAHAQLDLGRNVLELVALEQLHVGQEVLVNYGSDYFTDDYDGHRKSELLVIEDKSSADLDMRVYADLVQALLHTYRDESFQSEIQALRQPLNPEGAHSSVQAYFKDQGKRAALARAAILRVSLPILERFGFAKDLGGSLAMTAFLNKMLPVLRPAHEPRAAGDI
mmetsp:Transcript_96048/g.299112  ORF Transcript_96048/g.299112 Transcript_96048/m.299112 type:complete len:638 (-) Transcript_96048:46-1959(-)